MLSGHRAAAASRVARHPGRRRRAARRPEPAGSLRSRRRQQDALRSVACARGREVHPRRSSVSRVGDERRGRLHDQRRDPVGLRCDRARRRRSPDLFCYGAAGRLPRLRARLHEAAAGGAERSVVDRAQGPDEQHRPARHARVARSGRAAPHQLPLLRGRQRRERRGSPRRRRRRRVRPADLRRAEDARHRRHRGAAGPAGRRQGGHRRPTSATRRGAITPRARARSVPATRRRRVLELPGARRPRACASSTRRSSRGSPGTSS